MLNETQHLQRYGIAIASVVVALLLMLALDQVLHLVKASFLLFFGAVTISALYGGRGPGIVATLLSALWANFYFIEPQYIFGLSLSGGLRLVVFILEGITISWLIGSLRVAQAQIRRSFNQLKASEAEIKNLNQALQRRVDELQALFNVIPINIVVAEDPDCQVVRANPAYSKRLQIPPDANISVASPMQQAQLPYRFYQNGREVTKDELPLEYAAKHGVEVRDIEIDLVQQDHTVVNLYGHAVPLFDESGQTRGSIGVFTDITDRKRAETALRESEEQLKLVNERFQLAARAVNCLIYDWDLTSDRVERTDGLTRLLGYTLAEAEPTGQWWAERVHPDDLQTLREQAWRDLATEDTFSGEYRVLNKANQYVYMLDQCLVVARDAEGKPIRIVGSTIDISDRKRAALQLQESQRFIQQIANSVPGTLYVYDMLERRNVYVNRQIGELLGYTPEQIDMLGDQLFPQLMHPDDFAQLGTQVERLNQAKEGEVIDYEYRMRHADGEWRWLWSRDTVSTRTADGLAHQVVGMVQDISDRKQAEESILQLNQQLQEKVTELQTLLDVIPIGIGIAEDPECLYIRANPAFARLLKLPPNVNTSLSAPAAERPTTFKVHKNGQEMLPEELPLQYAAKHGVEVRDLEVEVIRQDGTVITLLEYASPLFDEAGQPRGSVGAFLDITYRKQADVERQQLLEREQTAREEAEQANRVKDEFLSILSHELRSPLNPILGWSRLLQAKQFDEATTTQALSTIERNARLQTQLIDDLLDVAKILRGKLNLSEAPVHLVSVVEAALEVVRTAAEAKAVLLVPDLADVGQVSGDSTRLQQIVWNLLSNAVKFTPNGGRVVVRLEQVGREEGEEAREQGSEGAGEWRSGRVGEWEGSNSPSTHLPSHPSTLPPAYAQITVTDTGKGISPEFLPHIFESFRQEDVSITRRYGGLGLGLSIVKYLVDAHGGTITADSSGEGRGSMFTVRLPLLEREFASSATERLTTAKIDLTGIKVLAVDDSADARELLEILLAQYGAETKVVASGEEVLAILGSFKPQVLVCDIGMPEMDGYMLLRRIRALPTDQGGNTPAIALTAYAKEEDYQRALAHGFQRHIAKPVDSELLAIAIAELAMR